MGEINYEGNSSSLCGTEEKRISESFYAGWRGCCVVGRVDSSSQPVGTVTEDRIGLFHLNRELT